MAQETLENSASDTQLRREELPDIQGLVTSGYGHLTCSLFMFLQIGSPEQARAGLKQLLPFITTSAYRPSGEPKPTFGFNIAFTYEGLRLLGLPPESLAMFAREFQEGMASGERPRVLGDTGDSAPDKWDMGGPNNPPFHLLLMLYAEGDEVLTEVRNRLLPAIETGGLKIVYEQDTGRISNKEPFGFEDGISQPFISGSPGKCTPGDTPVNAGEFVFGYRNGYDMIPTSPTVPASADTNALLPAPTSGSANTKDFGRNGTYLIYRKLGQNVDGFWNYVKGQAAQLGLDDTQDTTNWIAAKIVGRWPSGAPLTLSPTQDNKPDLRDTNDFHFMTTDAEGLACPIGAHIRRANPRDSLLPNPARSNVLSNRHRIVRRGRHFEDKRKPGETWNPTGVEPGLCFICLNADIQRQFEFVQQTWLNSTKFGGLYDEKDPLIGDNDDGKGRLSIPAQPVRMKLNDIPRFVRVRGGGYFFMPGVRALRFLAETALPGAANQTPVTTQTSVINQTSAANATPAANQKSAMDETPTANATPVMTQAAAPSQATAPIQATITEPAAAVGQTAGPTITTGGMMGGILHHLWQDALAEEQTLHHELVNLKEVFTKKLEGMLARPIPLRALFKHLREHDPIMVVPGLAVVSKYADVLEVLNNEASFSVTEIYAAKMERETGDFVLGMGDTPQYHRECELMHQTVHADDLAYIQKFVAQTADTLVATVASEGRIDAVGQLSRVVPSRLVAGYFGMPGPDEATQMRWMRSIFRDIFLNLGNDTGMREQAVADAADLNAYLNARIASLKTDVLANPERHDDFLSRLLKMENEQPGSVDDDTIRRILGGTIVGTVDTNSKAITQALDQLLDRPDALALAHQAALADDDATVAAYVFEALRFNPQNPFLLRHCEQDTVVAQGTTRERLIHKGTLVIVGTTSAMFDEDKFPDPDAFNAGRPYADYIHFGAGQHTCFGKHIAHIVIPGTAKSLLRKTNLRRGETDGQIVYDGAFPDHWLLEFDR